MPEKLINIDILRPDDAHPDKLWIKEAPGPNMSGLVKEYLELERSMKEYYESEHTPQAGIADPQLNKVYVARCGRQSEVKQWRRVKVTAVFPSKIMKMTSCFLLDYAEQENISSKLLREAPHQFLQLPAQARKCSLYNRIPLSLITDPDNYTTSYQPVEEWDDSAVTRLRNKIKASTAAKASLFPDPECDTLPIRLYLKINHVYECINDLFIEHRHAQEGDLPKLRRDIQELKSSKLKKATNLPSEQMSCSGHPADTSQPRPRSSSSGGYSSDSFGEMPPLETVPPRYPNLVEPVKMEKLDRKLASLEQNGVSISLTGTNGWTASKNVDSSDLQPVVREKLEIPAIPVPDSMLRKPGAGRGQHLLRNLKIVSASESEREDGISPPSGRGRTRQPAQSLPVVGRGYTTKGKADTLTGKGALKIVSTPNSSIESSGSVINSHDSDSTKTDTRPKKPVGRGNLLKQLIQELPTKPSARPRDLPPEVAGQFADSEDNTQQSVVNEQGDGRRGSDPSFPSSASSSCESSRVRFSDFDEVHEIPTRDEEHYTVQDTPTLSHAINLMGELRLDEGLYMPKEDDFNPEDHQVLYHGHKLPRATDLDKMPFADLMRKYLSPQEHISIRSIQMYTWPAINRSKHVAAVASARGGKTTAYLLPLIQQLQTAAYTDLPDSCGPIICVVASTWQKAKQVYDEAKKLVNLLEPTRARHRKPRAILIHGGEREATHEIKLLNGCEVLVATPHCLLRMLSKEKTTFDRLCHLVLDDADRLTEQFTSQVRALMEVRSQANAKLSNTVPQQLLAFASQWTPGMTSFTRRYMVEPTVVITALSEAAIFGGVRQECVECPMNQRRRHVMERIDPSLNRGQRTVIFVKDPEEVETLHKYLESACLIVISAHHLMEQCALEQTARSWRAHHRPDSMPTLITTDQAAIDLGIDDATCVIHYDPPPRSTGGRIQMGQRLWCMHKNFINPIPKTKEASACWSYLLVTAVTGPHVRVYQRLLQRSNENVPDFLDTLALQYMEGHDIGNAKPLCNKLKMFGRCRNETRCTDRHSIVAKFDSPGADPGYLTVPTQGHVKVLITWVPEATRFMGRLLQLKDKSGNITTLDQHYLTLALDMSMYFHIEGHKQPVELLRVGDVYVYEDMQHTFHRCRLLQHTPPNEHGQIRKAKVLYIDRGELAVVDAPRLYVLPRHFLSVPAQAIEVIPCRLEPADYDDVATNAATLHMSEKIFNKELEGYIVLALGHTLWLDPLEHRCRLESMNKTVTDFSIRSELIDEGWAAPNLHHLDRLYALCENRLDLPLACQHKATTLTTSGMPFEPDLMALGDVGTNVDVYVSAVDSPDLLYVRRGDVESQFVEMQEEIAQYVEMSEQKPLRVVKENMLVLTPFPNEDREWCRGKVLSLSGNEATVHFVDTGERESVPVTDLRPLSSVFLRQPFFAIQCGLASIEPTGDGWEEDAGDRIWFSSRDDNENQIRLVARIVSQDTGGEIGSPRYAINLYNTTRPYDVNYAEMLVTAGLAKLATWELQMLFPDVEEKVVDLYKTIPSLCKSIFTSEDDTSKLDIASAICQIVDENKADVEGMVESGIVSCLVTVLRFTRQPNVVHYITRSLAHMADVSEMARNEIREVNCISVACEILDQPALQAIHHSYITLLASISKCQTCQDWLLRTDGVRLLCNVLWTRPGEDVQTDAAYVLAAILQANHDKDAVGQLRNSVCLKTLSHLVDTSDNVAVVKHCLTAMLSLSAYLTLRDAFRPAGGVKAVCNRLAKSCDTDSTNQELAIKTLQALANNNRFNKDAMNECKMVDVLLRLRKSSQLSLGVRDTVEEMYQRLHAVLPSESHLKLKQPPVHKPVKQKILNTPVTDTRIHKREYPLIRWSQSRRFVLLCVEVRGLDPRIQPAHFTQNSIKFRAAVGGVEYAFTFNSLYEHIRPEHCEVRVLGSEVQLGLVKATKGYWMRLLSLKTPPSYLKVDHSRYVNSSSDSDADSDEEDDKSPLHLAKRNNCREITMLLSNPQPGPSVVNIIDEHDNSSSEDSDLMEEDLDVDVFRRKEEQYGDYHQI